MKTAFKNNLSMLKHLHKASCWYLPVNLLCEFIAYTFFLFTLLFNRSMLDYIVYGKVKLSYIVIGYAIFFLAGFFTELFKYWVNTFFNVFQKIHIKKYMQELIFSKSQQIDLYCYEDNIFLDKYSRSVVNSQNMLFQSADIVIEFCGAILRIVTIMKLLSSLDPIFIVASTIMCIHTLLFTRYINKFFYDVNQLETPVKRRIEYYDFLFKTYDYVKELKLFNSYDLFIDKYRQTKKKLLGIKKSSIKELLKILFTANMINSCVKALINIYVITQIVHGAMTIGDFTLVYGSVTTLGMTLSDLIKIIPNLKDSSKYINDLNEFLNYEPLIKDNANGFMIYKEQMLHIKLQHVDFSYPNAPGKLVLKDVSLNIDRGSKIAIVGMNGSGKSTFLKLLLNLYYPDKGDILCNDISYKTFNAKSLRSAFGVVFQDFQIFDITISENILMREVQCKADNDLVWKALEFSGLSDKIRSLEKGIHSNVTHEFDDDGVYLSGGELQKLAIARAYAQNANILIFDEPSSSLDPFAETQLMNKLYQLGNGKTVISVSHRLLSTISADHIYFIHDGRILEHGTHDVLMKLHGKYYEMFQLQSDKYRY